MAQVSPTNPNSLPGVMRDQPEVYEYEPPTSDDTDINDLDLINEPTDEAIALIEVPIKQAFSYFAERENEIAKFYVQRHGEYKISGDRPEEESDIEKYHRLVSEVNELLNKFQADKASKKADSELSAIGSLNSVALTNNLEILSRQLKSLEFAADDGTLNPTQSEFPNIKSKLEKLEKKLLFENEEQTEFGSDSTKSDKTAQQIRMNALSGRLNQLESLLGPNTKSQTLFKTTECESFTEAVDMISSWLSLFKPDSVQRVSRELDYLIQKLEKIHSQVTNPAEDKPDPQAKIKLDQLCSLATATDKYRAMVPTIIHRLNAMEELQKKAAQVTRTVNHMEQVQLEIVSSLQTNKDDLSSLNKMFAKNIELIKEFSSDIDTRIASIRAYDI